MNLSDALASIRAKYGDDIANAAMQVALGTIEDSFAAIPDLEAEVRRGWLAHEWMTLARPDQMPPPLPWQIWLYLAGRGSGKTRAGVEWLRQRIKAGAKHIALIAPTQGDIRSVMIEGQSGILAQSWEHDIDNYGNVMGIPTYEPSIRHRLTWANGAVAQGYSSEEPDRLRGPQHDTIFADELSSWWGLNDNEGAWNMAMMGLRLGGHLPGGPQVMIATTPKPKPLLRELIRSPNCKVTHATTYDNRANLAPTFLSHIAFKYEGTRIGRQELLGELLEESDGALWNRDLVDAARDGRHSHYLRVVVGVDPAVTDKASSSLTGIVVAARGVDGRGYVLADLSGRYTPSEWANVVVNAYDTYKADKVIAEGNQGGDLVRHTIQTVRPNIPLAIVHASRSKQARAEPVEALYEQKRVTHLAPFPELEDQMCTWEPLSGEPSPDRLDALVWALSSLMLGQEEPPIVLPFFAGLPRNIPGGSAGPTPPR